MSRRLALAVLVVVAALVAAVPALGASAPRISLSGNATFPDRSFALSLPSGTDVKPGQIHVTENGRPVRGAAVYPPGTSRRAVVLVIDASNSMKGSPIRDALVAAKKFASHRSSQELLGVVTFNRTSTTALQLTDDSGQIAGALSSTPQLAVQTHVYDAVGSALGLLHASNVDNGSIVVLSDGADTGSTATASQVAASARADGVRIFTVGLRSSDFDPRALSGLAAAGKGAYTEASSAADLRSIYDKLGQKIADEYIVQYRSTANPGAHVHVSATADGLSGPATLVYVAPSPRLVGSGRIRQLDEKGFWASSTALIVVIAGFALLLLVALSAFYSSRHKDELRRRVDQFVLPASEEPADEGGGDSTGLLADAQRSLEKRDWWSRFEEELEIASVRMSAINIVALVILATLLAMWLLGILSGSFLISLVGLGVPLGARAILHQRLNKQRRLYAEQLADMLRVISSAMRAGHSMAGALAVAVADAPEPSRTEFGRVVNDEQLGRPLDESLRDVARRMDSVDTEQVTLVASLGRETGGNTAEVLDRVAETVTERFALRGVIATLTAQGRITRWIVSLLPVILLVLILLINKDYLNPLLETTTGHVLLVIAAVMTTAGSMVIKRIVDIKV